MTQRTLSRRLRLALAGAVSAALLVAAGMTVWRVLRPSEVVNPAAVSYPAPLQPAPGKVGALVTAPLIVDDRIRVFAKKREVWADGPPDYHYERSAYWSYRRWPAQVVGLVVVPGEQPLVVSSWSDGMLVAIHATTGTIAWRVEGDVLGSEYIGRRTGAETVYRPPGLFMSGSTIITVSPKTIRGYRADGAQAWERPALTDVKCHGADFTGVEQLLVVDTCAHELRRLNTADGAVLPRINITSPLVEPISCEAGYSQCQGMRAAGKAWILNGTQYGESTPLVAPGSLLGNGVVVTPNQPRDATEFTGVDPTTGQTLWRWQSPGPANLLAASADRVFILTTDRTLASLDPHTGADLTRSGINSLSEPTTPYEVHLAYASHRYIVLERINPGVPETADDNAYYFTNRPALIAAG